MPHNGAIAALVLSGMTLAELTASATPALARGVGCSELPAYARAQGTLQIGEGACNMTIAEARRILAQERPDLYGPAAESLPRAHRKHRRHETSH